MSEIVSPRSRQPLPQLFAPNNSLLIPFAIALAPTTLGAITLRFPATAAEGTVCLVSDLGGVANANPVTLDGNGNLIDGAATLALSTASFLAAFMFDGGQWRRCLPIRAFDSGFPFVRYADVPTSSLIPETDFTFTHVANATCCGSIFSLITLLTSRGWTKTQDSDGTTYSAAGTQITHGGAGANGLNNNKAWFVIKMPSSNRSYCFQRSNTVPQNWRISYCADNAFTGGAPAAAQIPAPAGSSIEQILVGGGSPAAPTYAGQFAYADGAFGFDACAGGSKSKYSLWWHANDNATRLPGGSMFLDAIRGYLAGDADPYVFGCSGTADASFAPFINGETKAFAWVGPLSAGANLRGVGMRTYGLGANNLGASVWSGKDGLGPACWVRNVATTAMKGWSTLFQFPSNNGRSNMACHNLSSARDRIYITNATNPVVLPWDGTNTGVATTDAELLGQIFGAF